MSLCVKLSIFTKAKHPIKKGTSNTGPRDKHQGPFSLSIQLTCNALNSKTRAPVQQRQQQKCGALVRAAIKNTHRHKELSEFYPNREPHSQVGQNGGVNAASLLRF